MFRKKTPDKLVVENERLKALLMDTDPLDPDYEKIQKRLAINARLLGDSKPKRPPADGNAILATVLGIVQVGMILHHERVNAIATKALGFIVKLKP